MLTKHARTSLALISLLGLIACKGADRQSTDSDSLRADGTADSTDARDPDEPRPHARRPTPDDVPICDDGQPNCEGGPGCCHVGGADGPIVCVACAPDDYPECGCGEPNCDNGGQCCRVGGPTGPIVCTSCAPECEGPNPAANSCYSDDDCRRGTLCLREGRCHPSQCDCDPATGEYRCTDDCAGQCERPCGGFAGLECADDEVCEYPAGSCDVADAFGACRPRPEACTEEYDPVCGCDGVTYSNACHALQAGATIASRGACGNSGCQPVACDLFCENGFAIGDDGCEICACR